ncbi:MAG: PIN domain-containing protein [Kiritimatiellae bacterium]|nr:PIN domain-containing protein [Kiritimatiellia bacterium]
MNVLVDSSVWVDYFRGKGPADPLEILIEENLVVTNDLILTELIPPLHLRKQGRLIALLKEVDRRPITPDWNDLVQMQITCLKNGINGVGLPDLIIAQNAIQHDLQLLARDRHFALLSKHIPLSIYGE